MRAGQLDDAWTFLDAVYHGHTADASTIVRRLTPDDQNDLLWFTAQVLRGCILGAETALNLPAGTGLRRIRSEFTHPSAEGGPCG